MHFSWGNMPILLSKTNKLLVVYYLNVYKKIQPQKQYRLQILERLFDRAKVTRCPCIADGTFQVEFYTIQNE
jgi:hypothetical protein